MVRPPQSPDLNPIELLQDEFNRNVEKTYSHHKKTSGKNYEKNGQK